MVMELQVMSKKAKEVQTGLQTTSHYYQQAVYNAVVYYDQTIRTSAGLSGLFLTPWASKGIRPSSRWTPPQVVAKLALALVAAAARFTFAKSIFIQMDTTHPDITILLRYGRARQKGHRGSKHLILYISMTNKVIEYKEFTHNAQIMKIAVLAI